MTVRPPQRNILCGQDQHLLHPRSINENETRHIRLSSTGYLYNDSDVVIRSMVPLAPLHRWRSSAAGTIRRSVASSMRGEASIC